ncbi:LysM peptidoglycan-binding domain-containing protein [uncultured Microbacterium sp.]|uniref:Putative peptidoglycan-binding protein n=1 Tax=uncultured Microbacterium sp. TaxID=191216 RepID=A0A1Y5P9R8_9MICO|nr:LysM peptidoglycan-binding domain-containing protein [uncultured Microbacterium sp.]SBS74059.1 putative peptidoglycan-binding protein [uncultured Microbacterium sp.]
MRRRLDRTTTGLPATTLPLAIVGAMALSLTAAPAQAAAAGGPRDGAIGATPTSALRLSTASALRTTSLAATAAKRAVSHTVAPGDTVSAVAARHGLRTADVLAWNGLTWKSVIRPGQVLRLSPAAARTAAPKAASTTHGKTHTVRPGDTLWAIAQKYGVSVASVLRANRLSGSAIIYPGQKLAVSASAPAASTPAKSAAPAKTAPRTSSAATHTVRSGDTLWAIAQKHGISVATLCDLNGLRSTSVIHPGQKLKLALAAKPASSTSPARPAASAPSASSHTVGKGDTLWAIAKKHGISVSALLAANGLSDSSIIYPGQKLRLPARGSLAGLDAEQIANAKVIVQVGRQRGVPDRGIAIALATAMVESWMRNLDWGDRDSLGLFQQRPSQGWGTPAQVRDRARATAVFYGGASDPNGSRSRGLLDIPGWKSMGFSEAAQAVQISAYPDRYGQWEKKAYAWLSALG